MKFPKRMKPIIIEGHEAVEWFNTESYAQLRKEFWERQGFHVLLYHETEHWGAWFVCVRVRGEQTI